LPTYYAFGLNWLRQFCAIRDICSRAR
jgi:hypothetical protein